MCGSRYHTFFFRIQYYNVCITSWCKHTFLRINAIQLRRIFG